MRLINVHDFTLKDFSGSRSTPPYAILSHTWGDNDSEVTFHDIQNLDRARVKPGFDKIEWTCLQAQAHTLEWAWVDTCCIDKSSSHELSEAINSMFRWYRNSAVCYVYLNDVPGNCPPLHDEEYLPPLRLIFVEAFEESRWFTRGWTLQELIAPSYLLFFGRAWNPIAALSDVIRRVADITGIQVDVLDHSCALADLSVARRLSWAADRKTTRIEDEAYALLGILNVNMPLLYGEGADSFIRLQEAIIAKSTDQSIFAWDAPPGFITARELLLAPSPRCFASAGKIRRRRGTVSESAFSITNNGLDITLPVLRRRVHNDPGSPQVLLGILDCKYEGSPDALALVMSQHPFSTPGETCAIETYVSGCEHRSGSAQQYTRLLPVNRADLVDAKQTKLTITKDLRSRTYYQDFSTNHPSWFPVRFTGEDSSLTPQLRDVYPERCWSETLRTLRLNATHPCGGIVVDIAENAESSSAKVSVLIIFGTDSATSTRTIYDMTMVHEECPIAPHLCSLMARRIRPGGEVARIQLNHERQLAAHLFLNALTVSIEPIEGRSIAPSSPPTSPILSRASSSLSSSRRHDSFMQDTSRSDIPGNLGYDGSPRLSRVKNCNNCQALRAKGEEERRRLERQAVERATEQKQMDKQQKRQKQFRRAKQVGASLSLGSLLVDMGDLDFL